MTNAAPAARPGWYPDADGKARYWDGSQWTDAVPPAPRYVVASSGPKKTSHAFHLIMTLLTVGLWIPVWIFVGVTNSSKRA